MLNKDSQDLLDFITKCPSPFHASNQIEKILKENGFIKLLERNAFNITPNAKYYVTRNDSSVIAFKIGEVLDNYSFSIVASHLDSPTFKVKPIADINQENYHKLNVEGYGGMLCATFFDRPLSLAGRVLVNDNNKIISKLLEFDKDLLALPSIPIHFNREANDGFKYNQAIEMFPTIGEDNTSLKDMIAKELDIDKNNILSYDLNLYNRDKGHFIGYKDEFIMSPKLDDLACAYTSLIGFINSNNSHNVSVYACFDNEEVGSESKQGAGSTFLEDVLNRISLALNKSKEEHYEAIAKSFIVSADNAHAVHPNHPELTDPLNKVFMNKGIVIKQNSNLSYTTDGISLAIFKKILIDNNIPYQIFTNKSGTRGGGTLGYISLSHVSINSVDIGLAQLAMHSISETMGATDASYMINGIRCFYDALIDLDDGVFSV